MSLVTLGNTGWTVNPDHIVMIERRDDIQFARLVSGSTVPLADVYPLAYDLFQVSHKVWVNPKHVSLVRLGFNKGAAFRDVMADTEKDNNDYTQVLVETVLGSVHEIWVDLYEVDELDYLVELLGQEK